MFSLLITNDRDKGSLYTAAERYGPSRPKVIVYIYQMRLFLSYITWHYAAIVHSLLLSGWFGNNEFILFAAAILVHDIRIYSCLIRAQNP